MVKVCLQRGRAELLLDCYDSDSKQVSYPKPLFLSLAWLAYAEYRFLLVISKTLMNAVERKNL